MGMIATWRVEMRTGYDLSDNDRYRIRELIEDLLDEMAGEYCANLIVATEYSVPGPQYGRIKPGAWEVIGGSGERTAAD
jgi:hypothetical protein